MKTKKDEGHEALVGDVSSLLSEVKSLQFHDFGNTLYTAPKIELVNKLTTLRQNVIDGKYDN